MKSKATPEDRITAWLVSDAPPQAPDRVLQDTFEQTRQIRRRGSRLDWRIFSMVRSIALLTAATVVVVAVVLIGGNLLDRSPGVGGPPASPPPSPSVAAPSLKPTDTPRPSGPWAFEAVRGGGRFEPGTYTISSIESLRIAFTVPAGWERPPNAPEFLGATGQGGREIGGLSFWAPTKLFADPCRMSEDYVLELPASASVADVVAALTALPDVDTSSPEDVVIDGSEGTYLEMTTPCGDLARVRFWVLDVDGVRVVMVAHIWKEFAGSTAEVNELQRMVDSVRIERVSPQS